MKFLPRESAIERLLVRLVRKIGGEALKFVSPNRRFVSDRIVITPTGVVWFVEVKRPGGRLSAGQLRWMKKAQSLGLNTIVLDSKEAVEAFVNRLKANETTVQVSKIDLLAWRQVWLELHKDADSITPYDHYL